MDPFHPVAWFDLSEAQTAFSELLSMEIWKPPHSFNPIQSLKQLFSLSTWSAQFQFLWLQSTLDNHEYLLASTAGVRTLLLHQFSDRGSIFGRFCKPGVWQPTSPTYLTDLSFRLSHI